MKKILILAVLLAAVRALAVDDTPENRRREADRYLTATPPRELMTDMAEQMAKTVPPDQREALKNVFSKYLDLDAMTVAMRDGMVRNFSADELKALADFYGSPVGKSAMKKFGTYMAEVMPTIQAEVQKAMAKANRDRPDLKK